jgi:hypothetical protein
MSESTKCVLSLYIDSDLKKLAKQSGLNLSNEFETWLKIRVGNMDNIGNEKIEDTELLIAEHFSEIKRLQTKAEIEKEQKDKGSEEQNSLDGMIDDMVKFRENLTNPTDQRVHGVQFIFKKRYNKFVNPLEAKDMLLSRIKERGITEQPKEEQPEVIEEELIEDSEHLI